MIEIMEALLEKHSSELVILALAVLILGTLLILVPQLLRAQQRANEQRHEERMKALSQGLAPPPIDDRARAAGRTASLVPMVVVISAGTVTCFLVAYRSESLFSVAIAIWSVAGVVCLAAITGGVALLGRLTQTEEEKEEEAQQGTRN
ncbi:MAG TPA: hypothetical protein VGZ47_13960 [Gemmataceae bacterium]|jgi:uncharacterized membrane protein|nr:hypothetical protein [Gemmataceae bacterium]